VEHVYAGGPFMDRPYGSSTPKHTRYIAGDDIEIPWPGEDTPEPYKDEEWDTLRMEVETLTHKPSLEYAPFESSIMDELRNKYSKYRTRHDPEWVEAKKVEDLRREYLQTRTLLTPGGEAKLRRAAEKAEVRKAQLDADGNYILNKETSSFIERFMREQAVKGKASTA
jgi:large subunit ribosomal protein L24